MKRLITIILSMAILWITAVTAYAAEPWDTSSGTGESQIVAHVYSSYTITIPATINTNDGDQVPVTISTANLEDGYKVDVFVTNLEDNRLLLHHASKQYDFISVSFVNVEQNAMASDTTPLVTFKATETQEYGEYNKYFVLQVDGFGAAAGDYSGIMTYSFSCTPDT